MASIKERRGLAITQLKKWCGENGYGDVENPTRRFRLEWQTFRKGLWESKFETWDAGIEQWTQFEDYTDFGDGLRRARDGAVHCLVISTRVDLIDTVEIQF